MAITKLQFKRLKTTLPKIYLQVLFCDLEHNTSTLLHIGSQESLFMSWGWGSAQPAAPAGPPSPYGVGQPRHRCSGAAQAASRRAVGGMLPVCRLHRSRAHGSGRALSA